MTPEHEKARAWRESHGLSLDELSELTGYSKAALYWLERGVMAPGQKGANPREMNPYSWIRYKNICQAVDLQLRRRLKFDWDPLPDTERFPTAQE